MTLREAQILTLRILKQVMEEKLDQHNVQLAQVCIAGYELCLALRGFQVTKDNGFEILDETALRSVIEEM